MCDKGHHFEGWFTSLSDLERQVEAKILTCPICGADNIVRRPSTFGLVKSRPTEVTPTPQEQTVELTAEEHAYIVKAFEQIKAMTQTLEKDFDDVGVNFTTEALKMHYGASPKRNIRGMSTSDEEMVLKKEGVEFFKVPMLIRKTTISS